MARVVAPERRSLAFGIGTASGSFGQVVFSPLGQAFIAAYGWETALLILAATALLILPLAFVLPNDTGGRAAAEQTIGQALREAVGHRGFVLLTAGFFVCGFHIAFMTVHFPAYVVDLGLAAGVGAIALSLVGLFNIIGSFAAGAAGQRWSKKYGLSVIYFTRAAVILALLLAPKTDLTIYLFAAAMGLLWLSTVPLTSGIVAQVFGVRYMATLFGLVFLSHRQLSRRLARRLLLRPDRLVRRDLVGRRGAGAGCGAHPSADRRAPAYAWRSARRKRHRERDAPLRRGGGGSGMRRATRDRLSSWVASSPSPPPSAPLTEVSG
jgi:MFS family permease